MPTRKSFTRLFIFLTLVASLAQRAPDVSIFDDDIDDPLTVAAGNDNQNIFASAENLASLDDLTQTATATTTKINDGPSELLTLSVSSDPSQDNDWFVDSSYPNLVDFSNYPSDDRRIANVGLSSLSPKCMSGSSNRKLRSRTDSCGAGNPNADLDAPIPYFDATSITDYQKNQEKWCSKTPMFGTANIPVCNTDLPPFPSDSLINLGEVAWPVIGFVNIGRARLSKFFLIYFKLDGYFS